MKLSRTGWAWSALLCLCMALCRSGAAAAEITAVDPRSGAAADALGRGGTTLAVRGTGLVEGMALRMAGGGT